jgi:hypothetical protein
MEGGSTGSPGRNVPVQADGRAGWRLFHVVTSMDPPPEDFRSNLGRGEIPRPQRDGRFDAETLRRAAGVSCFATRDQARALAARFPGLGSFIAEIFIPDDDCAIEVARTFRSEGHYTVWASPAYFVSHVVSVEPI